MATLSGAFIQPGEVITLTAPYARTGGEGAKVGAIFGVAARDIANAEDGAFHVAGVFSLAKTSAQAWTQGQRIFWDDTNRRCDSDSTVGMLIGSAIAAAANPSSTGLVLLSGVPSLLEGAQAAVADVATADSDGTYGAAESTLINELKTQLNALLARLRISGIIS